MTNSARFMFIFGVIALFLVSIFANKWNIPLICDDCKSALFLPWVFRLISALAASAISISIPGMLEIRFNKKKDGSFEFLKNMETQEQESSNLAEKEPAITASGAIAVFILVYLFNPIV